MLCHGRRHNDKLYLCQNDLLKNFETSNQSRFNKSPQTVFSQRIKEHALIIVWYRKNLQSNFPVVLQVFFYVVVEKYVCDQITLGLGNNKKYRTVYNKYIFSGVFESFLKRKKTDCL